MVPEVMIDEEFVKARLSVEFPDGEEGEPDITIGEEVLEAMNGLWKNCMIVKVLGRSVPIAILTRKLRELWKPRGSMCVVDLPRQFFMVRFGEEEEYLAALTGGPWRAFGGYLMVQAWTPKFDPMKDAIVTTPVWVRLSNLPVYFYHKSILMGIASSLGKPVKVDDMTLNVDRARFARVCVEVDLRKPLKGSLKINKERYYVAYEGMSNICSNCGIYGNLIHQCPILVSTHQRSMEKGKAIVVAQEEGPEKEEFTMVRRLNRRGGRAAAPVVFSAGGSEETRDRNLRNIPIAKDSVNILVSNRFGNLDGDMLAADLQEVVNVGEENKENEIVFPNQLAEKSKRQVTRESVGKVLERNVHKGGPKGVRANSKPKESLRPKPKPSNNQPTRGLVFGLTKCEIELSASSKRLRVEGEVAGRKGGAFMSGDGSSTGVDGQGHNRTGPSLSSLGEVEDGRESSEMELQLVPQEVDAGHQKA